MNESEGPVIHIETYRDAVRGIMVRVGGREGGMKWLTLGHCTALHYAYLLFSVCLSIQLRPGPMWKALVSQDFDAAFESVNSNDPPKWATEGHHLMDYLDYIEFNATAFALPYSTKAY